MTSNKKSEDHSDVVSNNIDDDMLTEFPESHKTKIRSTFFTLNNPTEEDKKGMMSLILGKEDSRYLVYQLEVGENGTPHYQGFFYFYNQIQLGTLNKRMPRASFRKPRCIKACIKYCQKQESRVEGPFEFGKMPEQGRRTDLEEIAQKFLTLSLGEFVKDHPTEYIRYHAGLKALKLATDKPRNPDQPPTVIWLWGDAGVNKTRTAYYATPKPFIKDGTKWWDGYEINDTIIIDDFDGKWPFRNFLRLLDRYPYKGETKHGWATINSPIIYITCEHPPDMFWQGNELAQIKRRITEIKHLGGAD